MSRHLGIFFLIAFLLTLPPATWADKDPGREFSQAKSAFTRLDKSKGVQRTYRERWVAVIARFESFAARHPRHAQAAEALQLAARASETMAQISRLAKDAQAAQQAYLAVAERAPKSPFAAAALASAARLAECELNDPAQAYRLYARLADAYPQSKPGKEARAQLKRLAAHAPSRPQPAERAPAAKGGPGLLTAIRSWSNPGYTRIVIDLSQTTAYTTELLAGDVASGTLPRLYLDFPATAPIGGLAESSIVNDGLLRQIRTGRPAAGRTRVVLDLLSFENYKIFTLPEPFRIVIDITGSKALATAVVATAEPPTAALSVSAPSAPPPAAIAAAPVAIPVPAAAPTPDPIADLVVSAPPEALAEPPARQLPPLPARRIVIDAGHGGKDPGAIGPSGVQEKDVVLAMALLLAEEVRSRLGWEVVLTRSDDTFIPLEERTAIANKVGADLFLSVHANASPNASARGIETYYLNFSKNEKAAAVAARENGTTLREVGDLEQILFDLMAHSKIQESSRLASDIQNALIETLGSRYGEVKNLGVKQGPFYVLLGANMPSVLVEAAFISNPGEESRLASRQYQKEATRAIIDGLRAYAGTPKMVARQ